MSKFKLTLGLTVAVLGLWSGGCSGGGSNDGDDDDGSGSATGNGTDSASGNTANKQSASTTDGLCDTICSKEHDCDRTVDLQTCTNSCRSDLAGDAEKIRPDYLSRVSECFAASDCASVFAGEALGSCVEEAQAALTLTKEGTAFCSSFAQATEKCDFGFDKAACYDLAREYTDGALDAAEQCFDKSCSTFVDCVTATL